MLTLREKPFQHQGDVTANATDWGCCSQAHFLVKKEEKNAYIPDDKGTMKTHTHKALGEGGGAVLGAGGGVLAGLS